MVHKIFHWFGWNDGRVVSWRDGNDIYVAFRCEGCGEIDVKTINKISYKESDDHSQEQ